MKRMIVVKANYDAEAGVWWTESADIHGLRVEAASLEDLVARLPNVIEDLLEDGPDRTEDIAIEVIAHASTRLSVGLAA